MNITRENLDQSIANAVQATPVFDVHTHLYDPAMSDFMLAGIDELLNYHYLLAETLRVTDVSYEHFWGLSPQDRASLVWLELFERRSPISEATEGVVHTLERLGLEPARDGLERIRKWYSAQAPGELVNNVLNVANVANVIMTNSPLDTQEQKHWQSGFSRDPRFHAALRIDPLLLDWPATAPLLAEQGYAVRPDFGGNSERECRRFLDDWTRTFSPRCVVVSLPPDFAYPDSESITGRVMERALLPHCADNGLSFALMAGVVRQVNPLAGLAGDGVRKSDASAFERLFAAHPEVRFPFTFLARENQHEACVLARKFRNAHLFGCWWFCNTPSIIEELTRERVELLGLSFTAQHSDARVLDQLVYKWDHTREVLVRVLQQYYGRLVNTGWQLDETQLAKDVEQLLGNGFTGAP